MSKQSEAKAKQGYVAKAIPQTCCNCAHFASDIETKESYGGKWEHETNLRCKIGGFAVKKMGTCDEFEPKETA